MAYELNQFTFGSLTASSDYNDFPDQFTCVTSTGGSGFKKQTSVGGKVLGILQDLPSSGTPGLICVLGVTKARVLNTTHAAIEVMDKLRCSSNGGVMPSSASVTNYVIGRALERLSSNSTGVITILFRPEGAGSSGTQSGS